MRASAKRIVEDDDVARLHLHMVDGRTYGERHCAKVYGQMVALRDRVAVRVIDGAGVVQTLLDVGGEPGAAERDAHLFGDRDEKVAEDFKLDRIDDVITHRRPLLSLNLRHASR